MKTTLATGLVLGLFFAASPAGAAQSSYDSSDNEVMRITIGVYDYAHSKPGVLLDSQRTAAAILANAGVETVWVACLTANGSPGPSACASPADPTHLTLRVVPSSMSKLWALFNDGAFGYSPLDDKLNRNSWVLYDRAKDFAAQKGLTFERLLGAVIAHELGHLVLGENAHAGAGLMHGLWSYKELLAIESASLFFSDTERKRIQSGVIARREAASKATPTPSSLDALSPTALLLSRFTAAQQMPTAGPSTSSVEIPFRLHHGFLIVVQGRIGNLNGLRFLLDTGTTTSVLNSKIADKLNLPRHAANLVNYGKTFAVESATIPEVQFGPVHAAGKRILITDLRKFSDLADKVDALIGLDLLELNNLTVDYNRRTVLFSPIDHTVQSAQIKSEPLCFIVKAQVQGHPIYLIFDTGVDGVLLYEDRLRARVPGLKMEADAKEVPLGRRMSIKLAILPEMRVGPTVLDGRVALMEGSPGNMLDGIDGYIGIAPLHSTRIAFDFASKTLRWLVSTNYARDPDSADGRQELSRRDLAIRKAIVRGSFVYQSRSR